MQSMDMTKSLEVKVPHFQKDVIIPQIYDLNNIKVIQNYGYKNSPVNKVAQLKKQKIQNVVKGIVYKQRVEPSNSKPLYKSLTLKKERPSSSRQPIYSQVFENATKEPLFMEIDEQIGELIALADENFLPFAQRVKTVLQKVKYQAQNKELELKKRQADFFMNVICQNENKKTNPEKLKPVKGLLDQINDLQNAVKEKPVKRRAQSAVISRRKSIQHSPALYKFKQLDRSSRNLKFKNSTEDSLNKSKQIIKTINNCLEEESRLNRNSTEKMYTMKGQWSKSGSLEKTFIRTSKLEINPTALSILKEKRLRLQALSRIDNQYFKK